MRLDVHQPLWTEPLVAALARRRMPPRVRRARDGWRPDRAGEAPSRLELGAEDVERRAALVHLDGLDRALVALSAPMGIDALDPDEAAPVLHAHHAAVAELPGEFGGWASVPLRDPAAALAELDRRLDEGFAGLCLPAGAVGTPGGGECIGPAVV